jgi:hypothetical protein
MFPRLYIILRESLIIGTQVNNKGLPDDDVSNLKIVSVLKETDIFNVQGDQKVSVHLMITVKNTQKYFKQFKSLTVIT